MLFHHIFIVALLYGVCDGFRLVHLRKLKSSIVNIKSTLSDDSAVISGSSFDESDIVSPEIKRLKDSINTVYEQIASVQEQLEKERVILKEADEKYGPEIARLKEEFIDLRERTFAESERASQKAISDALKEVLPISDNFMRIKQLYFPLQSEMEKVIFEAYASISDSFSRVIEEFGITKVESLGKPFDFNFMEAISTMESVEYPANHVCIEYQIGYKIGDRCVRPSFVVVSTGPGPSN